MQPTRIADFSDDQLRERWRHHIQWIAEEADFDAGNRTRYRLIESWLFRTDSRAWFNRHVQAFGWISRLWIAEGLMSVRRQLDNQYGSVSLTQLLREIESRPEALPSAVAAEVAADRQALEKACEPALMFAQRQLAHRVPWDDPFVSLNDLDAALDAIEHAVRKYYRAITGSDFKSLNPEPDPDWLKSFEVPWRKPDGRQLQHGPRGPTGKRHSPA